MMASFNLGGASALPPLGLIAQAVPRLSRHQLETVVELLIERIDEMDPDPDIEPNGDELDDSQGEDGYLFGSEGGLHFPGCPISDPDYCEASDDRGTLGPNANFQGYAASEEWRQDCDCEPSRVSPENFH